MDRAFVLGFGSMGALFYAFLSRVRETAVLSLPERPTTPEAFTCMGKRYLPEVTRSLKKGRKFVFVCVRAGDLETALGALRDHACPLTEIVLCQNGVGIQAMAERYFPRERIHRVMVFIGAGFSPKRELLVANKIHRLELHSPPGEAGCLLLAMLKDSGMQIDLMKTPDEVEWRKAITNMYANPILALTGLETSQIVSDPNLSQLSWNIAREALEVAHKLGIALDENYIRDARKITGIMHTHRCSTLNDLDAGRRTEIEWLNGAVVRQGIQFNIPTPYNDALALLIRAYETHGLQAGRRTQARNARLTRKRAGSRRVRRPRSFVYNSAT